MRTLKAMEFAKDRRAKVISITDTNRSPMTMYSSIQVLAKSEPNGIADSLVAPFSLLNAIFSGLMPLGMILFGVLADIVSINYLIMPLYDLSTKLHSFIVFSSALLFLSIRCH